MVELWKWSITSSIPTHMIVKVKEKNDSLIKIRLERKGLSAVSAYTLSLFKVIFEKKKKL